MKRVGGQALPGGVIMRCGDRVAIALNTESGIELSRGSVPIKAGKLGRTPLLRGPAELASAMSASFLALGDRKRLLGTLAAVLAFLAGFWLLSELFGRLAGLLSIENALLGRCADWLWVLVQLWLFLYLSRLLPPIRRMYMYHGAEHKCISCYEAGLELTVENVSGQSRVHPRCGTNLMTVTVLIFVLIELFLPGDLPGWTAIIIDPAALVLSLGLAFELRRAGSRARVLRRAADAVGAFVQRHITTIEPEPLMIRCGIAAIEECTREEADFDIEIDGDK